MTRENSQTNPSPGWILQIVVPAPGQPLAVFTALDIGSVSLLSAEWVQGANVNVNTLVGLAATHGCPRILICDESFEFRSKELRDWAGAHEIVLEFKDLSGGGNRDIRFN